MLLFLDRRFPNFPSRLSLLARQTVSPHWDLYKVVGEYALECLETENVMRIHPASQPAKFGKRRSRMFSLVPVTLYSDNLYRLSSGLDCTQSLFWRIGCPNRESSIVWSCLAVNDRFLDAFAGKTRLSVPRLPASYRGTDPDLTLRAMGGSREQRP